MSAQGSRHSKSLCHNHCAIVHLLCIVNYYGVVFLVWRGPLGNRKQGSKENLRPEYTENAENSENVDDWPFIRNARLFIILFARNLWRVCSQFWLSVRNSV